MKTVEITIRLDIDCDTAVDAKTKAEAYIASCGLLSAVENVKVLGSIRTHRQNKALHLYFELLANSLNEAGADMRKVIRQEVDIPWSKDTVKEYLWRPLMEAQLLKKSTKEMDTTDIDVVYDTLNRVIGERTGVHVPFPSIEEQRIQSLCRK
jgi:hypothetical protein